MARGLPWWLFALSIVVVDQVLKLTVQATLPYREIVPVTRFFNLTHVGNPGAAFSILADAGGWQRYFFIVLGTTVGGRPPAPREAAPARRGWQRANHWPWVTLMKRTSPSNRGTPTTWNGVTTTWALMVPAAGVRSV